MIRNSWQSSSRRLASSAMVQGEPQSMFVLGSNERLGACLQFAWVFIETESAKAHARVLAPAACLRGKAPSPWYFISRSSWQLYSWEESLLARDASVDKKEPRGGPVEARGAGAFGELVVKVARDVSHSCTLCIHACVVLYSCISFS